MKIKRLPELLFYLHRGHGPFVVVDLRGEVGAVLLHPFNVRLSSSTRLDDLPWLPKQAGQSVTNWLDGITPFARLPRRVSFTESELGDIERIATRRTRWRIEQGWKADLTKIARGTAGEYATYVWAKGFDQHAYPWFERFEDHHSDRGPDLIVSDLPVEVRSVSSRLWGRDGRAIPTEHMPSKKRGSRAVFWVCVGEPVDHPEDHRHAFLMGWNWMSEMRAIGADTESDWGTRLQVDSAHVRPLEDFPRR